MGVTLEGTFGVIQEMKLDPRLRWFKLKVENPSDKAITAHFTLTGLWGKEVEVGGLVIHAEGGKLTFSLLLPPEEVVEASGIVKSP